MKGRRRLPDPARTEFNLTSMIDVVFQLLIYFIVGTTFAMGEQSYRMDLPEREGRGRGGFGRRSEVHVLPIRHEAPPTERMPTST